MCLTFPYEVTWSKNVVAVKKESWMHQDMCEQPVNLPCKFVYIELFCFSWFVCSHSSQFTLWLSLWRLTRALVLVPPECSVLHPHIQPVVHRQWECSKIQRITVLRFTSRSTFRTKAKKNKKQKHVALAMLDWNNCWTALGKSSLCTEQILVTEPTVNFDCISMFTTNKSHKREKTAHIFSPLFGGFHTEQSAHTNSLMSDAEQQSPLFSILPANSFSVLFKSHVICT